MVIQSTTCCVPSTFTPCHKIANTSLQLQHLTVGSHIGLNDMLVPDDTILVLR